MKINYDTVLELMLEQLMLKYNTETKQEALAACFKDLIQDMVEEAESQGKSKEEFEHELKQELRRFELKRLTNPEASACYHKILMMLKDGEEGG